MMIRSIFVILTAYLFGLFFITCNSGQSSDNNRFSHDTATIARGQASFTQNCSGCHNIKQDGIGPKLGGLTTQVSANWIQHFIKNPKETINSGDKRASQLYKKYKVIMPSFDYFSTDKVNEIIAFLNTFKPADKNGSEVSAPGLSDPISAKIKTSNLVVGLSEIIQIPPSSDSGKLPLTRITKLDYQPNTEASFILDLRGKLYKLQGNNTAAVYMDMAALKPKFINQPGLATGFGSFAFHPQFAKNGLIYTTHTEPAGTAKADFTYPDSIKKTLQWVLTEWKTDNPNAPTFLGTGREILRVDVVSGIHGVQEIIFNPKASPGDEDYGLLYIGIGDGGCVENGYPFLTHSPEKIWGTIIRINPEGKNSANGKYGIPQNNPFVKKQNTGLLGEIYAYGFRNPHRISWSKSGQMLACNIGHSSIESINLISKGHDYGWPIREGTFVLNPTGDLTKVNPLPANDDVYHVSYPVAEYDHDEGKAISGGFEYEGKNIPQLKGKYLFGDIPTGRLFYVEMSDLKQGKQAEIKEWKISIKGAIKTLHDLCGSDRIDLHFGKDAQGELYILTKADGRVYKLIGATE